MQDYLTYGLLENKLTHVSEVENGLHCGCVCPKCKHPLVAKNNPKNKKVAHFAHHGGGDCPGAIETALHLLAKKVLKNTKRLMVPAYHHDYEQTNKSSRHAPAEYIQFDRVLLETPVVIEKHQIVPDAIGEIAGKKVYIEFAKSHFVDEEKKAKIKKGNVACMEIDLKDQPLDEEVLGDFFNSISVNIYWIVNPRRDEKYQKEKRRRKEALKLAKKRANQHALDKLKEYKQNKDYKVLKVYGYNKIYNCPKEKRVLNKLKQTTLYQDSVLKRIIDGENWNRKYYGYIPNGKSIYIGKEKIMVYHRSEVWLKMSKEEKRKCKELYFGLETIRKKLSHWEFGACDGCKFSVDRFTCEDIKYQVCCHKG